jgi:hypothetical protein
VVYSVIPDYLGCQGTAFTYTITVNPGPSMNPVTPQQICSGQAFSTTAFTSPVNGVSYSWTLTSQNIPATLTGYPAGPGTGNISGTAVTNSGTQPLTLVYQVTPNIPGLCAGAPENFNLTVLPVPATTFSPAPQTVCFDGSSQAVNLSSTTPGGRLRCRPESAA